MSSYDLLEFSSKFCKIDNHNQCSGQWEGFGFQIVCNCKCHRKESLGKDDSLPNANNLTIKGSAVYE